MGLVFQDVSREPAIAENRTDLQWGMNDFRWSLISQILKFSIEFRGTEQIFANLNFKLNWWEFFLADFMCSTCE